MWFGEEENREVILQTIYIKSTYTRAGVGASDLAARPGPGADRRRGMFSMVSGTQAKPMKL